MATLQKQLNDYLNNNNDILNDRAEATKLVDSVCVSYLKNKISKKDLEAFKKIASTINGTVKDWSTLINDRISKLKKNDGLVKTSGTLRQYLKSHIIPEKPNIIYTLNSDSVYEAPKTATELILEKAFKSNIRLIASKSDKSLANINDIKDCNIKRNFIIIRFSDKELDNFKESFDLNYANNSYLILKSNSQTNIAILDLTRNLNARQYKGFVQNLYSGSGLSKSDLTNEDITNIIFIKKLSKANILVNNTGTDAKTQKERKPYNFLNSKQLFKLATATRKEKKSYKKHKSNNSKPYEDPMIAAIDSFLKTNDAKTIANCDVNLNNNGLNAFLDSVALRFYDEKLDQDNLDYILKGLAKLRNNNKQIDFKSLFHKHLAKITKAIKENEDNRKAILKFSDFITISPTDINQDEKRINPRIYLPDHVTSTDDYCKALEIASYQYRLQHRKNDNEDINTVTIPKSILLNMITDCVPMRRIYAYNTVTNRRSAPLFYFDPELGIYQNDHSTFYRFISAVDNNIVSSKYKNDIVETLRTQPQLSNKILCVPNTRQYNNRWDLLPCNNGWLDVIHRKFHKYTKNTYFTYKLATNWNPNATKEPSFGSNHWKLSQFISNIANGDSKKHLLVWQILKACAIGYPLTRKLMFIYDSAGKKGGHTGKSTLKTLVTSMVGADAVAPVQLSKLTDENHMTLIENKMLIWGDDDQSNKIYDHFEYLNPIVSGDQITARHKYQDPYNFPFVGFAVQTVNDLPVFKNMTSASLDRIAVLHMTKQYNYNNPANKAVKENYVKNKGLHEWLLHKCIMDAKIDLSHGFVPTNENAKVAHSLELESNTVTDFVENEVPTLLSGEIRLSTMYAFYHATCRQKGVKRSDILTSRRFYKELKGNLEFTKHWKHTTGQRLNSKLISPVDIVRIGNFEIKNKDTCTYTPVRESDDNESYTTIDEEAELKGLNGMRTVFYYNAENAKKMQKQNTKKNAKVQAQIKTANKRDYERAKRRRDAGEIGFDRSSSNPSPFDKEPNPFKKPIKHNKQGQPKKTLFAELNSSAPTPFDSTDRK